MRTFCAFFVLILPILAGEMLAAQDVWLNDPYSPQYHEAIYNDFRYDKFVVEKGTAFFKQNMFSSAPKTIGNFYAAGGTLNNTGHHLNIERFWVSTDTFTKTNDALKAYNYSINEFTLQVGKQSLGTINGKERTFGTASTVNKMALSDNSLSIDNVHVPKFDDTTKYITPDRFSVVNAGTIDQIDLSGGTFHNAASIGTVNYSGGNYIDEGGTIGTLNLAADSQAQSWGTVTELKFAGNDSGLINLTFTGFVENDRLSFSGIQVSRSVDFTDGNIVFDLENVISEMQGSRLRTRTMEAQDSADWAAILYERFGREAFEVSHLFDAAALTGVENLSMELQWGGGQDQHVTMMSQGVWGEGWAEVQMDTEVQTNTASVPEPATLAILGLGLTALGLAARRRHAKR